MKTKEIIINQPNGKPIKVFVGFREYGPDRSILEVWTESDTPGSLVFSNDDVAYMSDLLWSFKLEERQS